MIHTQQWKNENRSFLKGTQSPGSPSTLTLLLPVLPTAVLAGTGFYMFLVGCGIGLGPSSGVRHGRLWVGSF